MASEGDSEIQVVVFLVSPPPMTISGQLLRQVALLVEVETAKNYRCSEFPSCFYSSTKVRARGLHP